MDWLLSRFHTYNETLTYFIVQPIGFFEKNVIATVYCIVVPLYGKSAYSRSFDKLIYQIYCGL
jgi:hypothetical protein